MFTCLPINLYTYIVPNIDQQKIDLYINCVKVACLLFAPNPFLQNINPQKYELYLWIVLNTIIPLKFYFYTKKKTKFYPVVAKIFQIEEGA